MRSPMNKFYTILLLLLYSAVLRAQSFLTITDAQNNKELFPIQSVADGTWQNGSLSVKIEAVKYGSLSGWKFTFSDSGSSHRLLKVKFRETLIFQASMFWDGNTEHQITDTPICRDLLLETFPMAAAYNNETGWAVSLSPDSELSTLYRQYSDSAIDLDTRIVVDKDHPQTITVLSAPFTPDFGWRNAVDAYYRAFPRYFSPIENIDPRIYGVGGDHCSSHMTRLFQPHSARQYGMDWEWTYAPWYESGNWYAVGAGWQGDTNPVRRYKDVRDTSWVTRDIFDAFVRDEMRYGNINTAMFFYILVRDIHQNLANNYPEAVQGTSGLPSIPTNRGKTKSVFAPGSPIFDYLKEQLRLIVENYEVSGFAFDMANSTSVFNTPSQLAYGRGRTFDDSNNIYTSDTIVPIPFAEYIHTLTRNGKAMGCIFNMALSEFSPFTVFHADAIMMEGSPELNIDMVLPLRLSAGKKPIVFWGVVPYTANTAIKWYRIPASQRTAIAAAQAKLLHFKCLEIGAVPKSWNVGAIPIGEIEILRTIQRAGYQVIPAVKDAGKFWVGRFGEGEQTIITISNPERTATTATLRVINHYLGDGFYGFIPENGSLEQKIINGETIFTITLEPHTYAVLRAVKLSGNPENFTASRNGNQVTLSGNNITTFACRKEDMRGFFGPASGCFTNGQAVLTYLPICDFDSSNPVLTEFMDDTNTPAVVAPQSGKAYDAALMMSVYRPFVAASIKRFGTLRNREPGFMDGSMQRLELIIVSPDQMPAQGKKILIGTISNFPDLTPGANHPAGFVKLVDNNTLWIGGRNENEVFQAAMTYFDALDKIRNNTDNVNFIHPVGWGARSENFINAPEGGKYLQITDGPNNQWRYVWYGIKDLGTCRTLSFTTEVKTVNLTDGRFDVGFYEFDANGKTVRFTPVQIQPGTDWQTYSGSITLHPRTVSVKFYFLGRNMGKDNKVWIRSLVIRKH